MKTIKPRLQTVQSGVRGVTTAAERTRGYKWMQIRARVLRRDFGLCQQCKREGRLALGEQVDHIIPLKAGGTDDERNLQTLCGPCHRVKTASEATGALVGPTP